jgi:hypothetical protein
MPALTVPWRRALVVVGATLAAACHTARRSVVQLDELDPVRLAAERDSLFRELAQASQTITDIGTELAKVKSNAKPGPESPELHTTLSDQEFVVARARELTARLGEAEGHLAQSQRRASRLAQQRDSLGSELTLAQSVISDLQRTLASERETVASLTTNLETLSTANRALTDSVSSLTSDHNTAYYVIGSRKDLVARGILVEGRRSFPLVGRRSLLPARELPVREFTSIDRTQVRDISLPDSTRSYSIVSRQNLADLVEAPDHEGTVRGHIQIAEADGFWEPSKYLIVVQN